MKHNSRVSLCVLAAWLGCAAAGNAQTPPTSWAEKLFQGNTAKDFGVVPHGAQLTYRFPMKNIYAVPLEITDVRKSCGCVTATPSTKVLKPQESGYIDIQMDGTRFNGPKAVNIFVTVGPEFISTAVLHVSANARTDVVLNPGEFNFGTVPRGSSTTQVIDIQYSGSHDWRILEVVNGPDSPVEVKLTETFRQAPGRLRKPGKVGYRLEATLKPTATDGPFRYQVGLKTNDQAQVLSVPAEGAVQAALIAAPDTINGVNLKMGQALTKKVFVRGNRPFRITEVTGQGDGVTVQFEQGRTSTAHFLTVLCQPQKAGALQRQLVIRTDVEKESATVALDVNVMP
jgi:hypothetical protein